MEKVKFKNIDVVYSKTIHSFLYVEKENADDYDLVTYITRFFGTLNISFNTEQLYKALYLTSLNGGFEFIAIQNNYGFELIYIGKLLLKENETKSI